MTLRNVTTSSNLATVNASMVSGDTMLFAAGTYNVGTALNLVNGCSYIGNPGAILHATSTNDLMDAVTGTNANIKVSGLQFDGGNGTANAGIFLVGNNGINTAGNICITNNTFTNFSGTVSCIFCFQMDNCRFDNNTAQNCYQFVSLHNNDTITHANFSICGNKMSGISRFGIECQAGSNGGTIDHLHINNNYGVDISLMISAVDNSNGATDVTIAGNDCWGGAGIETANANALITRNRFTNGSGGLLISHGPKTIIYDNTFRNVATPFGKDGGFPLPNGTQWVGVNIIDGTPTLGWAGVPNDPTITPPPCARFW